MSESAPDNSQGNTDDLLAQLAGEEVDRLLTEADVNRAPVQQVEHVDAQEEAALTALLKETTEKELEQVNAAASAAEVAEKETSEKEITEKEVPENPTATTDAPEKSEAQDDVSAELDELFATLTTPRKEREPELPPPPPPVEPAVPESDAESAGVALEEKEALAEGSEEESYATDSPTQPVWWQLPLIWINAPFASLSEKTKEKIGWIGIETLIFALLLLAYVWWMHGKK